MEASMEYEGMRSVRWSRCKGTCVHASCAVSYATREPHAFHASHAPVSITLQGSTFERTAGPMDPNDNKIVWKDLDLDLNISLPAPLHARWVCMGRAWGVHGNVPRATVYCHDKASSLMVTMA